MAKESFLYVPDNIPADEAYPEGSVVYRPVLLLAVSTAGNREPIDVACVLDTGSDCCLLPARIAAFLGLELASLPQSTVTGIANQTDTAYYGLVTLELRRGTRFQARVGFSKALDAEGVDVLGQMGFFDQFNVEFRLAEGFFTIDPAATPAIQ